LVFRISGPVLVLIYRASAGVRAAASMAGFVSRVPHPDVAKTRAMRAIYARPEWMSIALLFPEPVGDGCPFDSHGVYQIGEV
jgi:hypothetical protein